MTELWVVQQATAPLAAMQEGFDVPFAQRAMGLVGIGAMIGIAWILSSDRRRVNWRLVGFGVGLQFVFGFLVLKTGVGQALFDGASAVFQQLLPQDHHPAAEVLTRHLHPLILANPWLHLAPYDGGCILAHQE